MNSNKGQSLVGVLVTMTVTVITMLMFAKIVVNQSKAINTANANSDITAYINDLRMDLNTATLATNALKGNSITGPIAITDPLNSGVVLAGSGTKLNVNDAWIISNVSIVNPISVPSQTGLYRLTLQLTFHKDRTRTIGYDTLIKNVTDVYCHLNSSNVIIDCLGATDTVTLAQQVCASLGGTWNNNTGLCSGSSGGGTCNGDDNGNHNGEHH